MTKVKWLCLLALGALVVVSLQPVKAYPPAGVDNLQTTAEVHLYDPGDPDTHLETIIMSGYAIVLRGNPYDPGDGRMTVETEIEELYLKGYSQYFDDTAHVTLNPEMGPAEGIIKQVNPGIDFPAESFFDVFYRITLGDVPPDPAAKSASARGSFGYDPESKTASAEFKATVPEKPSVEEITPVKVVGPATEINLGQVDKGVMDWCEPQWQGGATYAISGWFVGNEYYAAYQDPGDVCTDAYPFEVTEFHWLIQTGGAVTYTTEGYVYDVSGPLSCQVPGEVICESGQWVVDIPNAGLWDVTIPFGEGCCVYGPYFVGFWVDTDDPDSINLVTDAGPGDTCKTYNNYGPGWDDLGVAFDLNLLLWSGGYVAAQNSCQQVLINVDTAHMLDTIWQIPPAGRAYQDPRKIPLIDPVTGQIVTYVWHKHKVNPPDSGRDTIPTTGWMDIIEGPILPDPLPEPDETVRLDGETILRWGQAEDPGTGHLVVETELVAMDLTGESNLFGQAILSLPPGAPASAGEATSLPEGEFWPVESFFDVYYQVEFPDFEETTIIPDPQYEPPHMVAEGPVQTFPPEDVYYVPVPSWHPVVDTRDPSIIRGWVRPIHWVPPPPPPVQGACCDLVTGACRMADANTCNLPNERYEGDYTSCDPNPCPQPPTGACCDLVTGACRETTANGCNGMNEQYQGDGTGCDPNPCPQPVGACCDTLAGGCRQTTGRDCTGPDEIYMGIGVPCDPDPCPAATEPDTCEYYKPGYIDYCPNGMPDFDQRQGAAWTIPGTGRWSHCGPVALANCLWWFDSKFETDPVDPIITPGLNDNYPLVESYGGFTGPWDDHDPNNVMPLVDSMAAYCNTNVGGSGTNVFDLATGAQNWINNAGLGSDYTVRVKAIEPEWGYDSIKAEVLRSQDVILLIGFWQEVTEGYCERAGGHYVTVAGVCTDEVDSALCISDPIRDKNEGAGHADRTLHNNAANVSGPHGTMHHDRYDVAPTPCVRYSPPFFHLEFPGYQAGLPTQQLFYGQNSFDDTQPVDPSEQYPVHTIIEYAVIICPVEAQEGACCDTIYGTCRETTEADCNGQDEDYQGDGTLCSQVECPIAIGACCDQLTGDCIETTQANCDPPRLYLGEGTVCDPNPCDTCTTVVLPGVDLWTTPPGTSWDSNFTAVPVPADFFGPGSDPFDGGVAYQGTPLVTTHGSLGSTDAIVERLDPASLPSIGSSDAVDIEIVALSLVSTAPITVTYDGGQSPELWDIEVCLSTFPQDTGVMDILRECCHGGVFTSSLPVLPSFIFTRQSDAATRVLDFGVSGIPSMDFTATGYWASYVPPPFVLETSDGTDSVDHDCDSRDPVPIAPSSNFFAGMRLIPCGPDDSGPGAGKSLTVEEQQLAQHGVLPPQEEEPPHEGACCLPDGTCVLTTPEICAANFGEYKGDDIQCFPDPCEVPGACCYPDGSCAVMTPTNCVSSGGEYKGPGIPCDPDPCGQEGACCITEVTGEDEVTRCVVLSESDCQTQGGEYMGDGTNCGGDHNNNGDDDRCDGSTWETGDRHKMHFPQWPDEAGWDVMATSPITLADDWRCMRTGWVRDIHFWGSWRGGVPGEIASFRLSIHEDIPADPPSFYSRPGALLWERTVDVFLLTPKYPQTREGWFNPDGQVVSRDDHQAYFQYDIILDSLDWFWQDSGTVYWLDISANVEPGPVPVQWGWKSSLDHFNDNAVWQPDQGTQWFELRDPLGQVDDRLDLSFVITGSCCSWPTMGDADCNLEGPDIGDVTYQIRLLFITVGAPWCCFDEADLDGNGEIDIGDLTILINRLFISLRDPDPCP